MESNRNAPFGAGASGGAGSAGGQGAAGFGQDAGQQGVTDKAKEVAHEARQKAGEQVRTGLDFGKSRAAQALHGVAGSLQQNCETNEDGATRYIRQASDRVQRAADYLERTDVREMVRHTEGFARRQPALFLGGAMALGLIAARFLRSSQRENQQPDTGYEGSWQGMQRGPTYGRERPLSGDQTGASYADTPSPSIPAVPFGASSTGAGSTGASGNAGGVMSAGLGPPISDIDDAGETGMPPLGGSTRNRR